MKRALAIAIFSASLCTGSQVFAQLPHHADDPTAASIDPNGDSFPQQIELPPDPEGKAEELRLHGKCNEAIPILRRLSTDERDDIAQFNLGECLLDLGKTEPNAQRATVYKREGVQWIIKTANKGLPNAQSTLISVYLDGNGVEPDPVEAAKWALIYRENGTRMAIGMSDISHDLAVRLDSVLTEKTWDEAQSRASAWSPDPQNAGN
jgi:TPR repeat protein